MEAAAAAWLELMALKLLKGRVRNLGEDKQPGWAGLIVRCSVHAWQADPEKIKK